MVDIVGNIAAQNTLSGNLNAVYGKDGLSAYEIALANGFEGTEKEWLASLSCKTANGTVVSQNADFAEVAEWADGNPNNEDRTGYFVCANVPLDGIVMRKATSTDDVKGVSILAPAFAGNYTKDKLDSEGNLLPKYSYVAILGFVPVRDNGTCTVGGRCMPDDNGCAIPSSNSMGYQVVNRIDVNRVLIIIEPNGDMVQRIKTRINKMQEDIDKLAPDQTYDPFSKNAQSGQAVFGAIYQVEQDMLTKIRDCELTDEAIREQLMRDISMFNSDISYLRNADDNLSVRVDNLEGSSVVVDQTFSSTSENPQSGKAVTEAIANLEEHIDYTFSNAVLSKTDQTFDPTSANPQSGVAIEERLKSKVLLNTTLTEAQAGASAVSLAIPDWESLRKAKQWNIQIVFPYSGEYNANALSFGLVLHDSQKSAYNSIIASGRNVKFPSAYNLAYWNITSFNTTYQDGTGMLVSNYLPPHPWARVSAANSSTTLSGSNWLYLNHCITAERPPYLELKNDSNFVFEAGTRIYLEVVL